MTSQSLLMSLLLRPVPTVAVSLSLMVFQLLVADVLLLVFQLLLGSFVDPHCFQCGFGSNMLDQSDLDPVPDLGPDPSLHEGRLSYERSLQLSKENI